jgi:two-component system response regulator HydG
MPFRALVVDDDSSLRYIVRGLLEDAKLEVDEAVDGVDGLERVENGAYELVVTDVQMPRMDGIELLKKICARPSPPKVVVITAHGSERQTVEAIKAGAFDYFKKPFQIDEVMAVIRRVAESLRLGAEVKRLSGELDHMRSLIFTSAAMKRLSVLVQRIAPRDVTVLLTGESGTGKERVAEALVAASGRVNKPFVRFNCAALTTELADAELFGHTKGAFTGAVKSRRGLFREADGGTILLDEIGELAASIQAKLLRVLQEGEVRPVGADQPDKVDVRIIAATNRDLMQLAADGTFRADLYYRFKVVHLRIPPLRERPEDIPLLTQHFLDKLSRRFGVDPFRLTPSLLARLSAYSWPGNVRELENALESLVVLSQGNELDLSVLPQLAPFTTQAATGASDGATQTDLKAYTDAYEHGVIAAALRAAHSNRSVAARTLRISRGTLHQKLRKYGLTDRDTSDDDVAD